MCNFVLVGMYTVSQVKYTLYSTFHNIDCIKAVSQYQSKHNNVRFLMEKHTCLVELIKGITDWLINLTLPHSLAIVCVCFLICE